MSLKQALGIADTEQAFEQAWKQHDVKTRKTKANEMVTEPLQQAFNTNTERGRKKLQQYKNSEDGLRQKVQAISKTQADNVTGVSDSIEDVTPLVFDPDILSLIREVAPIMDVVAEEGQEGYKAKYVKINNRDDPIGKVSVDESVNLLDQARGADLETGTKDMTIYVDTMNVARFTQDASAHFMNVRETILQQRVAAYAQHRETEMLYGTPAVGAEDGSVYDDNAYEGLATIYESAGNDIVKDTVTENFREDILREIRAMEQSDKAIQREDIVVYTSHTMFNRLEEEFATLDRHDTNEGSLNYGKSDLSIGGVPVVPSHLVSPAEYQPAVQGDNQGSDAIHVGGDLTSYLEAGDLFQVGSKANNGAGAFTEEVEYEVSSTSYDSTNNETEITVNGTVSTDHSNDYANLTTVRGNEGDVFLIHTGAARFRALTPFSSIELGTRGASEEVAMFEFGSLIDRADGEFGRYLKDYQV